MQALQRIEKRLDTMLQAADLIKTPTFKKYMEFYNVLIHMVVDGYDDWYMDGKSNYIKFFHKTGNNEPDKEIIWRDDLTYSLRRNGTEYVNGTIPVDGGVKQDNVFWDAVRDLLKQRR
jgi:hypothetical protein